MLRTSGGLELCADTSILYNKPPSFKCHIYKGLQQTLLLLSGSETAVDAKDSSIKQI